MSQRARTRAGEVLKNWRRLRGLSQIELADQVRTSARNLSFVENGRAVPSEDLTDRLCSALGLDSRSRDLLLRSAGYARTYAEPDLTAEEMSRLKHALERTVKKLEPCPAIVIDRATTLITSNSTAMRLLHWLAHDTVLYKKGVTNMSELALSQDGLRPYICNWEEVGQRILDRMYREIAIEDDDGSMTQTYERWLAIEGVPAKWAKPPVVPSEPIMRFHYKKDGQEINLESLVFTLGTPADLNYQEIRLRCWLPIDEQTREFLTELSTAAADPKPSPARVHYEATTGVQASTLDSTG